MNLHEIFEYLGICLSTYIINLINSFKHNQLKGINGRCP